MQIPARFEPGSYHSGALHTKEPQGTILGNIKHSDPQKRLNLLAEIGINIGLAIVWVVPSVFQVFQVHVLHPAAAKQPLW